MLLVEQSDGGQRSDRSIKGGMRGYPDVGTDYLVGVIVWRVGVLEGHGDLPPFLHVSEAAAHGFREAAGQGSEPLLCSGERRCRGGGHVLFLVF